MSSDYSPSTINSFSRQYQDIVFGESEETEERLRWQSVSAPKTCKSLRYSSSQHSAVEHAAGVLVQGLTPARFGEPHLSKIT